MELSVVMAMMAVVMTGAARMIGLLMKAEGMETKALVASRSFFGMGQQFRSDVHRATSAELRPRQNGRPATVSLQLGEDRQVLYRAGPNGMRRLLKEGGQRVARETYRVPKGTTHFEFEPGSQLLRLLHTSYDDSKRNRLVPDRSLRIEAVLDRDGRFGRR